MTYQHTQTGWPMRIAFGLGAIVFLVMSAFEPFATPTPRAVLIGGAIFAVALGFAWSRLTISIDAERVRWWYGLRWPRFSLALQDIAGVDLTTTTFLQGWGVHRTRQGWLYNIAGRDAIVIVRRDGRRTLLGTDEPRRLKAALERALARPAHDRMRA